MSRFRHALALVFVGLLAACSGGGSSYSGGGATPPPVPVAPQITSQPVSATVTQGATVTFSVSATGSDPMSFQWKKNGAVMTGIGSSIFQITSAQAADAGTYLVVVSNNVGSATSSPTTLVVNPPPLTISVPPTSLTVTVGQSANFTVAATGGILPYSFQWKKNGLAVGGNSYGFSIPASLFSDAGSYTVTVTDASPTPQTVTSGAAILAVNPTALMIGTQPTSQSVTLGQNASFSVTATGGTPPYAYQWKKGTVNIGSNSQALSIPNAQFSDAGTYAVTVTDASPTPQSVTSSGAPLTVNPTGLVIATQPVGRIVTVGQPTALSVAVSGGTLPYSYQWKRGTTNTGTGAATLNIPTTQLADAGSYTVVITDSSPTRQSATSNVAILTVNPTAIRIATQPASTTVSVGATAFFTVAASGGTVPYNYQWKKGTSNLGTGAATLSLPSAQLSDSGSYIVTVTDNSPTPQFVSSGVATLTVLAPIVITAQPQSVTVALGSPASFSVTASGSSPAYQWKRNGTNISGATNSTYSLASVAAGDQGAVFSVVVSNPISSVASSPATLTVTSIPPTLTTQPANQTVAVGATAAFSVVAAGTAPLAYQWYKNGAAVGTSSASYGFSTVAGDNLASIYVKVSNAYGNATSNTVTLTLTGLPTLDLTVGKIQLNQAIQVSDDSVPIVSGRDLVFRVYPLANQTNTAKPTIKVSVYNSGALLQAVSGSFTQASVPTLLDLTSNNVVELQVSGVNVKNGFTYTVVIDPLNLITEINKTNNTVNGALTTITVHSLPVNMVPLKIGSNVSSVTTIAGAQAKYGQNMKSVLPVSTINYTCSPIYTVTTTVANPAALNLQEIGGILLEVENKRLVEGGGVLYVGLYNSDGASASGVAFVPGFAALVQHGGMAMEHEITHLFGVSHVSCPGYNIGNEPSYPYANGTVPGNSVAIAGINPAAAMNPDASPRYDYMTYCFNWWVSDWTYKRVITAINSKGFSGAASIAVPMDSEAVVDAGESMLISGSYEVQSGNWSIGPAYNLGTYLDLNEENWEGNGLEVRVLDITGKVLAKKNFRLGVHCENLNVPFRYFSIRFNGNFDGATEIQIVENGKVVASQKNNDNIDEPFTVRSSASHKTFVHSGKAAMVMNEKGEVLTVLHNNFEILETLSDKFTIHVSNGVRSRKFGVDLR